MNVLLKYKSQKREIEDCHEQEIGCSVHIPIDILPATGDSFANCHSFTEDYKHQDFFLSLCLD